MVFNKESDLKPAVQGSVAACVAMAMELNIASAKYHSDDDNNSSGDESWDDDRNFNAYIFKCSVIKNCFI